MHSLRAFASSCENPDRCLSPHEKRPLLLLPASRRVKVPLVIEGLKTHTLRNLNRRRRRRCYRSGRFRPDSGSGLAAQAGRLLHRTGAPTCSERREEADGVSDPLARHVPPVSLRIFRSDREAKSTYNVPTPYSGGGYQAEVTFGDTGMAGMTLRRHTGKMPQRYCLGRGANTGARHSPPPPT
jgi:hypothetical protein